MTDQKRRSVVVVVTVVYTASKTMTMGKKNQLHGA